MLGVDDPTHQDTDASLIDPRHTNRVMSVPRLGPRLDADPYPGGNADYIAITARACLIRGLLFGIEPMLSLLLATFHQGGWIIGSVGVVGVLRTEHGETPQLIPTSNFFHLVARPGLDSLGKFVNK